MKEQVKTPVIVVAIVLAVGIIGYFGMKSMNSGGLDHGQVQYTPGKPPWLETDVNKRGPGASPGAVGPGGPPPGAPTPGGGGAPPGMGAPVLGNK